MQAMSETINWGKIQMILDIDGTNFKPIPFLEIEIVKGVYTPTPHF